jgi:HK97 family phage major capsid protein
MNKLLKLLKAIFAKGFATAAEKAQVQTLLKELDADGQEVVADDVAKVDALPENKEGEGDQDIQDGVKALIKAGVEAGIASVKGMFEASVVDMKSDVEKFLKEQAELREKKAGIYHPEVQAKRAGVNAYLRKFLNAQFDNDVEGIKALNGGMSTKELTTDSSGSPYGGYVVDKEISFEIRHLLAEYGAARREMFTTTLSKNSYDANTLVTDVTVFWVDQAGPIKSTQIVLGKGSLTLNKLAAIVTLTRELLEDEEIDLFSFIGARVAQGFAKAEDLAFFNGDGTGTYGSFTGLLRNTNTGVVTMASGKTTFGDITADNLLDMQDATPTEALDNAKYYMHRSILSYVRKLKDTTGNYIYQNPGQGLPATLWGKPVVLVEAFPASTATAVSTSFVLFGDLKKAAILGYKGAISADRFQGGVVRNVADNADINLITSDREAIRWVERVGYLAILPTAVTRLKTAAS